MERRAKDRLLPNPFDLSGGGQIVDRAALQIGATFTGQLITTRLANLLKTPRCEQEASAASVAVYLFWSNWTKKDCINIAKQLLPDSRQAFGEDLLCQAPVCKLKVVKVESDYVAMLPCVHLFREKANRYRFTVYLLIPFNGAGPGG